MVIRGVAQLGSALGSGPRGRKFKSCFPDGKSGTDANALRGQKMTFGNEVIFYEKIKNILCNKKKHKIENVIFFEISKFDFERNLLFI